MDTVFVVEATGNVGISAVIGALNTKRDVLAFVRNEASAEKMFEHVGTRDNTTTVVADIISEAGVE